MTLTRLYIDTLRQDEITSIEARLRPRKSSHSGFLGSQESLKEVIYRDADILQRLGVSHEKIAEKLESLIQNAERRGDTDGFKVEILSTRGTQVDPFQEGFKPGTYSNLDVTITNQQGESISFGGPIIGLIRNYQFFEGREVPYRLDPEKAVRVLGLNGIMTTQEDILKRMVVEKMEGTDRLPTDQPPIVLPIALLKQGSVSREEKMKGIMDKIKSIDRLPTYEEAEQLLYYLEEQRGYNNTNWSSFCREHGVHAVYTVEFLEGLAKEIGRLNDSPIIEICAGNGKLSHQLRKRGIDIRATDDYSGGLSKESLVERLSHQEALERYKPKVVVASWIPYKARIGFDVLDSLSVKYFIDIGEDVSGATWMTEEIHKRTDWKRTYLKNVEDNIVSITDYPDGMSHSGVSLFRRK